MKIIVYTTDNCPHCEQLKLELDRVNTSFESRDMATAESLTELKVNGCFALAAPVLRIGDSFYEWDKFCMPDNANLINVGKIHKILGETNHD